MSKTITELSSDVEQVFMEAFGRTPLRQRLDDIRDETIELCRYTDFANLQEEAGDLLASLIMLCNENRWSPEELVQNTLSKITVRQKQYHSLGRKTKVAIMGGAFDPITIGHIKLAQFVLDTSTSFDEVFLMPCYHHMYNKETANESFRLKMCEIAAKMDGRIKVFDYEIKKKLRGETYNLVKHLLNEDFAKNQYDFSMIIGMDNANTFSRWINYEDLERMIRFVVVNRRGVEKNEKVDWYTKPPHIYLHAEDEIPEISSTQIRDAFFNCAYETNMRAKELAEEFLRKSLPTGVFDYIREKGLYVPDRSQEG